MRRNRLAIAGLAAVAAAASVYYFVLREDVEGEQVVIPVLTGPGMRGQASFGEYCAECHGGKADGTGKGPPLIHRIYHPGHHGDASFFAAAQRGTRAHHWPFGDMPPVAGVSDAEIADIVAFIREVQFANGIY